MTLTRIQSLAPRAASVAGVVLLCAFAVAMILSGSPMKALALLALFIAPFALYLALTRPFVFPFGLYVLLIPFDNLLSTGSFGTITKLLGIVSCAFLFLWTARTHVPTLKGRSVIVLCALVLWMLLSAIWALDQTAALQAIPTLAGLIALYIVIAMVPVSTAQFRMLLFLTVASGLVAAVYGANVFYHDPSLAETTATTRLILRSGSTIIDPNQFANSLLFPAAIIMMWSLRTKGMLWKLAGASGLSLFTMAILLSGSREAFLGLLLIIGYYIVRSRHRLWLAIGASGVLAAAGSVQTSIWLRFATVFDTGGSGRTSIWAVGLEAAKHRFLYGYGIGNFANAYDIFYLTVHQTYPYGFSSPAHNLVLHYIVELGIVGLALIVYFFWAEFRSLRKIEPGTEQYDYRIMLEGSLIALAAVSLTIDLFTYKYAWLVFSMFALLRHVASTSTDSSAEPLPEGAGSGIFIATETALPEQPHPAF